MTHHDRRERRMRWLNGIMVATLVVLFIMVLFGALHQGHAP